MQTVSLILIEFAATVHLMMSVVSFLYARHKVSYLPLAWIMLIFCALYAVCMAFVFTSDIPPLGLLHPTLLIYLMACSFLQSIYPLGIVMPGYLQMKRMCLYASPAIGIILIYTAALLLGSEPMKVYEPEDFLRHLLSGDVLLRLATLGLSTYYIVNIFRLPHRLAKHAKIPKYLKAYGTVMGLVSLYFVFVAVRFSVPLLLVYMVLFTLTNFYMFCRTLETTALSLPPPAISVMEEKPEVKQPTAEELEDFNEANRRRFETIEFYMQHGNPWADNLFGRDKLCEATGINRHLLLQCVRSQGYNNVHEYINRYRVEGIKRGVESGQVRDLATCLEMGFGSAKTARTCFEKMEGISLDEYLAKNVRPQVQKTNK